MELFETGESDSHRMLGGSGLCCSSIGWSAPELKLCGEARFSIDPDAAPDPPADVLTLPAIAGIQEAVELGVTVFDVGCVVRHRTAVGERLAWLNQSVDLAAGARNCGAPENLRPRIVLVRFSLRRCAPSAVTLNYWQQAESQQVIVAQLNRQLEAAVSTIKESLTHPAAVRCVWVWEDWDLPPEANRQQRSARDQLFQVLRASIDQQGWLQGVAGMHWQSLAELAGSPKISVLQLHAGFGVLGPSREDSLVPICRVRGLGLLGTLPGYSGLLRSPLQLPPSHPATAPERKAAETARILAEEFGFDLETLSWSIALQSSVDCLLLPLHDQQARERLNAAMAVQINARSEAMVLKHLQGISRDAWV